MTRRKGLTIALSLIGVFGLIFVLLLLSKPTPAVSHSSYAWKPGCHCGKPTTTTARPTTTTARPTTTAKPTTTTTKPATKAITTATSKASTTTTASETTKSSQPSTPSSSTGAKKTAKAKLVLGALAAAALTDPGDGGPSGGAGGTDGSGGSEDPSGAAGENADGSPVNATATGPPHYYLSPVAIAFLLVYGVSFVLYRTKKMRVTIHRKIWNVLLLATFLICGLIGLVLAVGIMRDPPWELPTWLLVWHVETGIAMCFISFFHVGWHLKYYLAIVTGKRRVYRTAREPAVEKRPAPRSQPRRPLVPRTDAERMLAFRRRQTARAEAGRARRGGRPVWTDPLAN